jgi:hypothetical protein
MAQDARVRGASAAAHQQIGALHENEGVRKCWGTLRRGGVCRNRDTCTVAQGGLPTCKVHRKQVKEPASCKASLACGFNCGRLLEWEPHGFQLCLQHREDLVACYFLDIPIEIRCRIYRYLLPDTDIPARFCTSRSLTTRREQVYTAILGVNRQIHEEATRLLYSTNVFAVEVSESMLSMCNLSNNYVRYDPFLRDQVQLTLFTTVRRAVSRARAESSRQRRGVRFVL